MTVATTKIPQPGTHQGVPTGGALPFLMVAWITADHHIDGPIPQDQGCRSPLGAASRASSAGVGEGARSRALCDQPCAVAATPRSWRGWHLLLLNILLHLLRCLSARRQVAVGGGRIEEERVHQTGLSVSRLPGLELGLLGILELGDVWMVGYPLPRGDAVVVDLRPARELGLQRAHVDTVLCAPIRLPVVVSVERLMVELEHRVLGIVGAEFGLHRRVVCGRMR